MITYIPFLKAKQGERGAMSQLKPEVREAICPFFDFPRKKEKYDGGTFASTAQKIVNGLTKHWGPGADFYFDDRDLAQKDLKVAGKEKYAYMLGLLSDLSVIPVVGLSRQTHNASVADLKHNGDFDSEVVAFRILLDDFEDFNVVKDQLEYELDDVFAAFTEIDLIFDCQVCTSLDASKTGQQIAAFTKKFSAAYNVRRVIVTGSSIPQTLSDIVKANKTTKILRHELAIIAKARDLSDSDILPGDYTTVCPFFSDADFDPKLFQKITAPRLIYTFKDSHYVARGASLESAGHGQYLGMTKTLCGQGYFRHGYSSGDDYFTKKSKPGGGNATNASVVTPSVVAHITYMVLGANV